MTLGETVEVTPVSVGVEFALKAVDAVEKLDSVPVAVGVVKSVDCQRMKTALAFIPSALVIVDTVPAFVSTHS